MFLIPAEHIMGAASGRPCPNGAEGRRPHLGRGGRRPPTLYAPPVSKALASASIKSIGHPLVLKTLAIHLFQKPPATTCSKAFPGLSRQSKSMFSWSTRNTYPCWTRAHTFQQTLLYNSLCVQRNDFDFLTKDSDFSFIQKMYHLFFDEQQDMSTCSIFFLPHPSINFLRLSDEPRQCDDPSARPQTKFLCKPTWRII